MVIVKFRKVFCFQKRLSE